MPNEETETTTPTTTAEPVNGTSGTDTNGTSDEPRRPVVIRSMTADTEGEESEVDGPPPEVIEDDEDLLDDYPLDTTELDLIHLRILSIPALKLDRFMSPGLTKLCLRQNRVSKIEALTPHKATLTELDLYDNAIAHINGLEEMTELENLDLSFNSIKHIKRLETLKKVQNLYFVQNRISRIEGLDNMLQLKNLELGANRIREIENIGHLTALEELWLGKNKITELKNLDNLTNLRILSIQSNRLLKIQGLEHLNSLEELYISHNALTEISGLASNRKLRVLDVSNNQIEHFSGLEEASDELEEVWASSNKLSSFDEVEHELKGKAKLETVYLEGNPLQRAAGATYRNKVRLALPQIRQIDATFVR